MHASRMTEFLASADELATSALRASDSSLAARSATAGGRSYAPGGTGWASACGRGGKSAWYSCTSCHRVAVSCTETHCDASVPVLEGGCACNVARKYGMGAV